jgi:phage I-like protein
MSLRPLFNRDGQLPADAWYHLVPRGEFPVTTTDAAGQPVQLMQVLDDTAIRSIVDRFAAAATDPRFAGVLIDQDHFSYDPEKSSEAMGWIREVQARADGVWGRVEWTDLGTQALANRRYKFISPVWSLGQGTAERIEPGRVRPLAIETAGLTNSPNLPGLSPLTNRIAPAHAAETAIPTRADMNSPALELGLDPAATEAVVAAAIRQLQHRATAAEGELAPLRNRVVKLEADLLATATAHAEAELAPLRERITAEELAPLRDGLIRNRAATLPLVHRLRAQFAAARPGLLPGRVLNRADGRTPDGHPNAGMEPGGQQLTQRRESEIENFRLANRCTYEEARHAVRRTKPDLFA